MVDYRQQRLGVPPPPPGSMAFAPPAFGPQNIAGQGLVMPPQQLQPMGPAQIDMPGPGIGQVKPPMAPTPQMETGPEPQIGMQPQVIQTPPATPQGNLYDDPETIKLQQQAYKKALASFGGAGATPEEARQQKALSLFGNIIAPAMAAFGKGGVSAAGVQLMNKAQNDIQAKKSEHKQSQNEAVQALTMLNNMSKIRNDDFHKQTQDEMKAKMIADKEDRDKTWAKWKSDHEETLKLHEKNMSEAKAREFELKTKMENLQELLNPSKIAKNEAAAKNSNASAESTTGLLSLKKQKLQTDITEAPKRTQAMLHQGEIADKKLELQKNPPEKPDTEEQRTKMGQESYNGLKKAQLTAQAMGKPAPTAEDYHLEVTHQKDLAKEFLSLDQNTIAGKLRKMDKAKKNLVLDEMEKLQNGK